MAYPLPDLTTLMYIASFGLILIGIAGIVFNRHLIRIIFGVALLEAGANMLLLLATFNEDARAPILLNGQAPALMADPVPQALVLTAIVIGVGVLALALTLAIRVHAVYGTLDIQEIRERLEADIAAAAGTELPYSIDQPKLADPRDEGAAL
jgi:multisubunit Na+/H+ antiporter MnhC subunit